MHIGNTIRGKVYISLDLVNGLFLWKGGGNNYYGKTIVFLKFFLLCCYDLQHFIATFKLKSSTFLFLHIHLCVYAGLVNDIISLKTYFNHCII